MDFPIELKSADAICVVQNDDKPTDTRRFHIKRGLALPDAIFDIENRGKRHADPDSRFVVRGLKPGWSLVSLTA